MNTKTAAILSLALMGTACGRGLPVEGSCTPTEKGVDITLGKDGNIISAAFSKINPSTAYAEDSNGNMQTIDIHEDTCSLTSVGETGLYTVSLTKRQIS